MKKFLLIAFCFLLVGFAQAQRYAIIDTKYILEKMPEYTEAQKNLDGVAAN